MRKGTMTAPPRLCCSVIYRQRDWCSALLGWAKEIRGRPYVWGDTDCGALVRTALHLQCGVDVFAGLPGWVTARQAAHVWGRLCREAGGGYGKLFASMGAVEVRGRKRGRWPMGAILVGREDAGVLPAFGIYVSPIVVQSDMDNGVQWSDPTTADALESAWLFERVSCYGR